MYMKRSLVVVLLFVVALSVEANSRRVVGSFRAMDGYDYKDLTVAVWTDPTGSILIGTPTPYTLTQKDREALISLLRKAVHYTEVAKDNSTEVDYQKNVGSLLTEDGAYVVVKFSTNGWQHSLVEVWVYDGGRNTILSMSAREAADMVSVLTTAEVTAADFQKQIALFNY